ncbi:hypothetical protein OHB24_00345 [Kribbella sp. NBC_00482]|uniref:hypothetical protein n=1 Tax=Kribbella sp. NBC_00482 TaxID=2975968 RepID=UPI002E197B04
MLALALSFEQEIWLRILTALSTALFVSVGAGLVTIAVQRKNEEFKAARDRLLDARWSDRERELDQRWADRERELDDRSKTRQLMLEQQRKDAEYRRDIDREERALRHELVERASEVLGGFYFATQSYWRQRQNEEVWGKPDGAQLDATYVAWAKSADTFERGIGAVFGWASEPVKLVHQSRDLLTVRYFHLRGRNTDALRRNNAKKDGDGFHSGLTVDELTDWPLVLKTHRACLTSLVDLLLTARTNDVWPTSASASIPS